MVDGRRAEYLCSGASPVTKSASTHLYFFARTSNSEICCFDIKESFVSPGSDLYVQYEHVSLQRLTILKNAFLENVTESFLNFFLKLCETENRSFGLFIAF